MSNEFEEFASHIQSAERVEEISRRALIRCGLAATALTADLYTTDIIQNTRNYVQVAKTHDTMDSTYRYESWMVLPGFKMSWEDSRRIANSLAPTMLERGHVSYVGYSNEGLDVDEVVESIDTFAKKEKIRKLHLYGHSFGGMVSKEVAEQLASHSNIEVDAIAFDSTPSAYEDIYEKAEVDFLSGCYEAQLSIPTTLRGMLEIGERTVNKHERTWRQVLEQSLRELTPGAPSSKLILSEASYIRNYNPAGHPVDPSTKFGMLANMEDKTVNISSATQHWSDILQGAFGPVEWTRGAKPAHASPFWNQEIYNRQFRQAQARLLPYDRNRYIPYQYLRDRRTD